MPTINFLALAVAAAIPNAFGALFYGPLVGDAWRKSMGKTKEEMKYKNEALVYGGAYVAAFIVAFFLNWVLQMGHKDVNAQGELFFNSHQTFGHGAFHGFFFCLGIVVPVIVSLNSFHKVAAKTTVLNVIFWLICFVLMGGVLDVWH